ncbi:MAG: DUF2079 domain-containing protein, partial [Ktedonobacteraceae bacterium]|nr:DUF2079 domain-containing protein [Ktedonobacteraceae bacterium]
VLYCAFAFAMIKHFYPGEQGNNFWYRYEELGSTPGEALLNVVLHPWLLFTLFITVDRVYYLFNLMRSQGFLSLLAPEWLLPALPALAINLLSTYPLYYSGVYHYNAVIIPFIMISSIHGLKRLLVIWQGWRGEMAEVAADPVLVVAGVGGQVRARRSERSLVGLRSAYAGIVHGVVTHPTVTRSAAVLQPRLRWLKERQVGRWQAFSERMEPLARAVPARSLQWLLMVWIVMMIGLNLVILYVPLNWVNWADHLPGAREQHVQHILDMIPPDASVSAGGNLNPHLTRRQYVTVFPQLTYIGENGIRGNVQYVVVDLGAVFPEDKVSTAKTLNQLVSSGAFRVLAQAEDVILLVRQSP